VECSFAIEAAPTSAATAIANMMPWPERLAMLGTHGTCERSPPAS
jgi:hypothetical protein